MSIAYLDERSLLNAAIFERNASLANHKQIGSHYCAVANSLFSHSKKSNYSNCVGNAIRSLMTTYPNETLPRIMLKSI